jgi:hypothetical protein
MTISRLETSGQCIIFSNELYNYTRASCTARRQLSVLQYFNSGFKMSTIQADNLFNVNGMVFVITGGGSGMIRPSYLSRKRSLVNII